MEMRKGSSATGRLKKKATRFSTAQSMTMTGSDNGNHGSLGGVADEKPKRVDGPPFEKFVIDLVKPAVDDNPPPMIKTTATFQGLGDLPGGNFASLALGVSGDGSVVVGRGESVSGEEAIRWTQTEGLTGLGDLSGGNFASVATKASADGSVIIGHGESGSGREAFRWTIPGGMIGLGDLPAVVFVSEGHSLSADGSLVVGTSNSSNGTEAYRWTDVAGHDRDGSSSG